MNDYKNSFDYSHFPSEWKKRKNNADASSMYWVLLWMLLGSGIVLLILLASNII